MNCPNPIIAFLYTMFVKPGLPGVRTTPYLLLEPFCTKKRDTLWSLRPMLTDAWLITTNNSNFLTLTRAIPPEAWRGLNSVKSLSSSLQGVYSYWLRPSSECRRWSLSPCGIAI